VSKFGIKNIRTLALVGQAGSGKTSLAEALMARAGTVKAPGSVERGNTVCDYLALEKELQHSLKLAVASFEAQDTRIHLLDTPGYPDFMGHSLPALTAVETAAIVVNAQNGIELMTQRMMHWAEQLHLDRLIVVNRIDAENVDLPALLAEIQATFGKECLPLNLPAAGATRVSDCFFQPAGESDFSSVEQAHRELVDQVVEVDEELMAYYLEHGEVSPDQLHEPLERALREGHLIPVVFTSAKTGAGIAELLDVIVKLLPNPTEGNPPLYASTGPNGEANELAAVPDPGRHVLAHVFKLEIDPFIGRVAVFRVHQGRITPNMQLYAGDGRKAFKPGHLWLLRGKQQIPLDEAVPGDICAIAKVEEIRYDHILHDAAEDSQIHAHPLEFPSSVFGLTLLPKRRGDEQKLSDVLHRFTDEDPCFHVERNAQANETVIRGLGELHLRTLLGRMAEQYKLELDTKPPSIPFRETISAKAEGHSRHKKQTGGAGQFGEVYLRIEPLPRGGGFEFRDEVKGGVIPNVYIPAVEKGVRSVLETGFLAGYPLQDVRVIVYDGKSHPVDSKEVAFVSAGRKAFLDALAKARALVLEPVVNIDVVVPDGYIGDLTGDLSGRRAHVRGTDNLSRGLAKVSAQVPLSELENFPSRLKSLTAGEGSYTLEFSHYDPAPGQLQQKLVAAHKPQAEEA
jgi:elongation factor G